MWEKLGEDDHALSCRPPFSFFQFISERWKSAAVPRSLHRICTLARKMGAVSLVVEGALGSNAVVQEIEDVDQKLGPDGTAEAVKLSFFSESTQLSEVQSLSDESFIGQATLINYRPPGGSWITYVYEAIIRLPRIPRSKLKLLNNYYHTRRPFQVVVHGKKFIVDAVYYCQQNGVTNVCAHAALRMALNTVGSSDGLISNKAVQEALGVDPAEVYVEDIERVLEKRQLEPYVWGFGETAPRIDYFRLVYSIVESGYPALLVFSTADDEQDHVIPVWGHTLNLDEWHPEAQVLYAGPESARYYPSSAWADHFLIHDDNFGPYYCLARDVFSTHPKVQPRYVVGLFPRRIGVSPVAAENLASSALRSYLPKLAPYAQGNWSQQLTDQSAIYVLRTLLIRKDRYLEHLRTAKGHDRSRLKKGELIPLQEALPEEFWMTEFTLPHLYAGNKSKLGELLVASTSSEHRPAILALRIPSAIVTMEDPLRGTLYRSACCSHLPLARVSLHDHEW